MSSYIHGTAPEEQARLSKLNDLLNSACLEKLAPERGSKILDVGSGLGQFTRLMARACGGRAVGVERSQEQLEAARALAREAGEEDLVEFREGDAYNLPLGADERATFDIVHARFILEHVQEPLRVVHQMVEAAKPRGRIVLMDDDHELLRLYPDAIGFMQVWAAYMNSYRALGADPEIGRKLPELISRAGALPVKTDMIFFGGCKGQPEFDIIVPNMLGLMNGARETMLANGLISESAFGNGLEEFRAWAQIDYANMLFTLPWAEGVKL